MAPSAPDYLVRLRLIAGVSRQPSSRMATDAPQPSLPPLPRRPSRRRGAMRGLIAAAVLGAAVLLVLLAAPVVRRHQRRATVERALGRVQEGMQLTEVTELLRRLEVEFAVDSAAGGGAVVRVGREVVRDGKVTKVTEQQLVFDAQQRLRDMATVAHVRHR